MAETIAAPATPVHAEPPPASAPGSIALDPSTGRQLSKLEAAQAAVFAARISVRVYHLRRRLPRKGGSSFYRDTRPRVASTYCGALCTDIDGDYRSKAEPWMVAVNPVAVPCPDCREKRFYETDREG